MGFNDYLGPLVNVEGTTSISTILLVDVDVGSFSLNKYAPTPWVKHTKATVRRAPSLGNSSYSKSYFSHPSPAVIIAVAVVVVLPSPALRRCHPASYTAKLAPRLAAWLPAGPTGRPCLTFIIFRLQ